MDAAAVPPPLPPFSTPSEPSSLTDRLTDVIAAPGQLFEEIKHAPMRISNWLVPLILSSIGAIVFFWIAFSQPAIQRDMQDQRVKASQKRVAEGKVTQAQADQGEAAIERIVTPTVLKIIIAGVAVAAYVACLFLMGAAIWLALKWTTGAWLDYMKVVEICGLAMVINVPQIMVRSFLVLWKENLLATASPTLFLAHPSTSNKVDVFLSMLDVGDFWRLGVLSLGVARVASIRYRTAAFITFGIWFGFRIIFTLLTPS